MNIPRGFVALKDDEVIREEHFYWYTGWGSDMRPCRVKEKRVGKTMRLLRDQGLQANIIFCKKGIAGPRRIPLNPSFSEQSPLP